MNRGIQVKGDVVLFAMFIGVLIACALLMNSERVLSAESQDSSFTYQGYLADGGIAVDANCDMRFRLFADASGDTVVSDFITRADVVVNQGIFNVNLDFGNVFATEKRWLEVRVRCPSGSGSYTVLSPRTELTGAPFAHALPGVFADPERGVGINTIDPADQLDVNGAIRSRDRFYIGHPSGNSSVVLGSELAESGYIDLYDDGQLSAQFGTTDGSGNVSTFGTNGSQNTALNHNTNNLDYGQLNIYNDEDAIQAHVSIDASRGNGVVRTVAPNGSWNVNMTSNAINYDYGWIGVYNSSSNTRALMTVNSTYHNGELSTYGPNGTSNVYLGASTSDASSGFLGIYNSSGWSRVGGYVGSTSDSGVFATYGPSGNRNVLMSTSSSGGSDAGWLGVFDSSGSSQAGMYVNASGQGVIFGDVSSVRVAGGDGRSQEIWYSALAGPEAATYIRGTAELIDGAATIILPDHFVSIVNLSSYMVQLTPLSAESLGLAVVEKAPTSVSVLELHQGQGNYEFDFFITATRAGHENYEVARSTSGASANTPEPGSEESTLLVDETIESAEVEP